MQTLEQDNASARAEISRQKNLPPIRPLPPSTPSPEPSSPPTILPPQIQALDQDLAASRAELSRQKSLVALMLRQRDAEHVEALEQARRRFSQNTPRLTPV